MEMFSDDFISYNNEMNVKLEKSSDHDISLNSPTLRTCESTPNLFPMNFSPSLQSLLIKSVSITAPITKKYQPFTIIKAKREESFEDLHVKVESEDKILNKSKLIMKREKAKQRAMTRTNKPIYLKLEPDVVSEVPEGAPVEGKNKKKVLQMIRNRISAQTSRDRKKAYLYQLEDVKTKLYTENALLKQQNTTLLQELSKLKDSNKRLSQQNNELRSRTSCTSSEEQNDFFEVIGESSQRSVASVLKNVESCNSIKEVEGLFQDKSNLNEVYTFANMLSSIVCNQFENPKQNMNSDQDEKINLNVSKGIQEEVDHLAMSSDEKQNTILHHLMEFSKPDRKQFSRATKENYSSNQSIFSLTNFDLTEAISDYSLLKDVKQEDTQYNFGVKASNLL